jgi:ATP-dependent RNA helicase RhlE
MQRFHRGELKVMIATDVSARGIDIPDVEIVVNYDLPETPEFYVHRVGRTGRGNSPGVAVSFCSKEEKQLLSKIEAQLPKPIHRMEISSGLYRETIESSQAHDETDWKSLLDQETSFRNSHKKKKKHTS